MAESERCAIEPDFRDAKKTSFKDDRGFRSEWFLAFYYVATFVAISPFLLVNRGYTHWFHIGCLFFLVVSRCDRFWSKYLALQGTTVTLGWYASLTYDWVRHGHFARILYWNLPEVLTRYAIVEEVPWRARIAARVLAHVLDTLGHPVLALYFWRRQYLMLQRNNHGKETTRNSLLASVATWPVIFSTYFMSRYWSFFHAYWNHGAGHLFYVGYEVYDVLDKEAWLPGFWLPAYIAEGLVYFMIVVYKLYLTFLPACDSAAAASRNSENVRSENIG
eukprot:CAMPEP_0184731408 /NCGR_PEP_ID=MMETSP0314-20130426/50818_1 /TAXON_ID=38298 /ORGANISM="Rhodella maculata, Strain CCMP 736" /LENGTH=275 /DNA_ID=CAMNT_0027197789 /DNA_START=1 /DNA_END=828 /DNA_ORIENTATION=+